MLSTLIVEDVDEMRALLEETIKGIPGLKISGTAQNSAEARLEVLRRRPDFILLDEILPGESSRDLLNDWVQDGIPVILITSLETKVTQEDLYGAKGRMMKPTWDTLEEDRTRIQEFIFSRLHGTEA